jgi:hypothetical protein
MASSKRWTYNRIKLRQWLDVQKNLNKTSWSKISSNKFHTKKQQKNRSVNCHRVNAEWSDALEITCLVGSTFGNKVWQAHHFSSYEIVQWVTQKSTNTEISGSITSCDLSFFRQSVAMGNIFISIISPCLSYQWGQFTFRLQLTHSCTHF